MRKLRGGVPVVAVVLAAGFAGGCEDRMVGPSPAPPSAVPIELASAGGPRPLFPATVTASTPPPPISGGTLLMTHDGKTAVAADPDRDALYVVDVSAMTVRYTVALNAGDEPGRLVEDGAGRVHVALRSGGALVTIDPTSGAVLARRSVCPAPRGLAWDGSDDSIVVACATGELVTLPAAGGAPTSSVHLERDLRDVVIQNGALSVSSFRMAQVLRVAPGGAITRRDQAASPDPSFEPRVVWRTTPFGSTGNLLLIHQTQSLVSISTTMQGGYGSGGGPSGFGGGFIGGGSGPVVFSEDGGATSVLPITSSPDASDLFVGDASEPVLPPFTSFGAGGACVSAFTVLDPSGNVLVNRQLAGVLPVDVAVSPDGTTIVGVTPGGAFTQGQSNFFVIPGSGSGFETDLSLGINEQPIAVSFDGSGNAILQTREPAKLWVVPLSGGNIASIQLSATSRDDTGHDVFHTQAGAQIACASCHPEGGDDAHVWILDGSSRRTPSLRGTIAGTAPYHWPGDEPDLDTLVNDVYTVRMDGARLPPDQMGALKGWVQTIPAPAAPSWVDPNAASQGRALFESASTGCTTCHSGAKFTSNATVDVGTGGAFQVPPLVGVGWRTPLMHDGRAATIADRFGAASTPQHGNVATLSPQDITNLTAYLETL